MADGIPTDYVLSMRQQGLSNNQIIQSLQRAQYAPQQIADAMAQADIKYDVEAMPMQSQEAASAASSYGQDNYPAPPPASTEQESPMSESPAFNMAGAESSVEDAGISVEALQQLIEQIIEEKWDDLVKNVSRVVEWKDKMDTKIATIEQQIAELRNSFDKLHTSILEKIGDYDKTMTSVGTDIKALEQVFKKILPGFVENVSELSRITEDLKKKK